MELGPTEDSSFVGTYRTSRKLRRTRGKYRQSVKTLKPFRFKNEDDTIDSTGLFSSILVSWLSNAIYKARKSLTFEDLPGLSKHDRVSVIGSRMQLLYNDCGKKQQKAPRIKQVVFRFCRTRFIFAVILCSISMIIGTVGPAFVVNELVKFTTSPSTSIEYGIGLSFALLGVDVLRSLTFGSSWIISIRTSVRLRSALSSLLYWKLIGLKGLQDKSTSEMINLLVNDMQRIFEMYLYLAFFCSGPFGIIAGVVYAALVIGWTALIGLAGYLIIIPVQLLVMRLGYGSRLKAIVYTDKRVRVMNEILNCIKLIKFYAWESNFTKSIDHLREHEEDYLRLNAALHNVISGVNQIAPVFVSVITLLVHTALGYPLTAAQAFTTIVIFSSMRLAIGALALPMKAIAEALVAFKRIDEFLCQDEVVEYTVSPDDASDAITIKNVTASAAMRQDLLKEQKSAFRKQHSTENVENETEVMVIKNITLNVKKGSLIGVCGPVGSGKTSLISAIMGELRIQEGSVGVDGKLAYVPQQAWIFQATVRENILFGLEWNQAKYNRVLNTCNLRKDIDMWPNRDLTEVGERGITLSGGQKQRISLARAVYSERDIVLLDDPLSAVDAHVGKHIFFKCIKKELTRKTVIFVTHQLQYLKDCDDVIMLKDGRTAEHGKHNELMMRRSGYFDLVSTISNNPTSRKTSEETDGEVFQEDTVTDDDVIGNLRESLRVPMEKRRRSTRRSTLSSLAEENIITLMIEENHAFGGVDWKSYQIYFKAAGGYIAVALIILVNFLAVTCMNAATFWMTYWINQGGEVNCSSNSSSTTPNYNVTDTLQCRKDANIVTNPKMKFYQVIYGSIFLGSIALLLSRALVYPRMSLKASSELHSNCLNTIMRCPMSFFDCTPIGHLLNRFSNDVDQTDSRLPLVQNVALQQFFVMVVSAGSICFVFPLFLVAVLILCVLFVILFNFFRAGSREFKRFENICRSPWISHIAATTNGLSSIHVYQKSKAFIEKFANLVDVHSRTIQAYYFSQHWVTQRLECITIAINFLVAILSVIATKHPTFFGIAPGSALVGLALTYAIQMTGMLQFFVRYAIETETLYTSVERLREYTDSCSLEAPAVIANSRPDTDWPSEGRISFRDVSMRYREALPEILRRVSFSIAAKEKIGIAGRTGSGKSSIGVVLFRLVELSHGQIFIDDVNIAEIGLEDLRKKLTIIPQDPVLFVGSIHYNLDPFQQYSDDEIWKALERCHIKNLIHDLPMKLQSEVVENGENFSVGERQLLCLARAILRHSKIIMLDEATAAIDSETDSLVQDTIREAFADCTMLTIAHRLNTILSSDKILVMEKGEVVEFDSTISLINDPRSAFSQLLASAALEEDCQSTSKATSPFS